MGTLLGHPLDIIKVRMQVAKASAEKVKKGLLLSSFNYYRLLLSFIIVYYYL